MTNEATQIDHAATQRKLRGYDLESLWFVVQDTQEAMDANPTGHKAGFYADEQHYAHMEISRRRRLTARQAMLQN